jgi:UDP-N-acetylglucosamine:LPS N-acetylglucosamine transferase
MFTSLKPAIAILHFSGETFRGTEACVVEAINGFHEQGYDVIFLANNPQVVTEKLLNLPKKSLKVSYPEIMWDDKFSFPIFRWIAAVFKMRKILAHEKPSLILASGGLPNQIGLPVARLLGLPIAVHFHPPPKRYFYFWMLPWADKIIVPSKHTQAVVKNKCNISSVVVYNGMM